MGGQPDVQEYARVKRELAHLIAEGKLEVHQYAPKKNAIVSKITKNAIAWEAENERKRADAPLSKELSDPSDFLSDDGLPRVVSPLLLQKNSAHGSRRRNS